MNKTLVQGQEIKKDMEKATARKEQAQPST